MKSPEVYAAIREGLGPSLKSLGFRREKAFLSWSREHEGQQTVLWCQVSRDGWDDFAGSKFVVELQRSKTPEAGAPSSARARLGKLLTDDQRAEAGKMQSLVIASLTRPPRAHPALHVSPDVTRWYLQKFEPLQSAYGPGDDLWLRYAKVTTASFTQPNGRSRSSHPMERDNFATLTGEGSAVGGGFKRSMKCVCFRTVPIGANSDGGSAASHDDHLAYELPDILAYECNIATETVHEGA